MGEISAPGRYGRKLRSLRALDLKRIAADHAHVMDKAAVVIIGAGVMGASTAYHLARRSQRDVVVVERSQAGGGGSTGVATGGFRAQFATDIHVRLSLLAREKLRGFREEIGVDAGYQPAGYLWLASSEKELETLRAAQRVQHAAGLDEAVELAPEDIAKLNPKADLTGVIGGAFCPSDGFIRPMNILEGYIAAARRLGVSFEWGTNVTGLTRDATGALTHVRTPRGEIAVGAVVNAAGAWAGEIGKLAGIDIPVTPLRRQVAATVRTDALPANMPMTIWLGNGFHLRVRDGRVLLLMPVPGVPGLPYDTRVDPEWIAEVTAEAHRRVPILRDVRIDPAVCHAGLYEMTADRHALLGAAHGCPNLYLINGSCGHGVMHAPALGALLAEIMCDGKASSLDVTALDPSRFAEQRANAITELL